MPGKVEAADDLLKVLMSPGLQTPSDNDPVVATNPIGDAANLSVYTSRGRKRFTCSVQCSLPTSC